METVLDVCVSHSVYLGIYFYGGLVFDYISGGYIMSGIYVEGWGAPANCGDCAICNCPHDIRWSLVGVRPGSCPIRFVQTHGRLIDADALMESLGDVEYKGAIKRVLIQAPTVLAADKAVI